MFIIEIEKYFSNALVQCVRKFLEHADAACSWVYTYAYVCLRAFWVNMHMRNRHCDVEDKSLLFFLISYFSDAPVERNGGGVWGFPPPLPPSVTCFHFHIIITRVQLKCSNIFDILLCF